MAHPPFHSGPSFLFLVFSPMSDTPLISETEARELEKTIMRARLASWTGKRVGITEEMERVADQWHELAEFVRESNRIEGISRDVTNEEVEAHRCLLALDWLTVDALCQFVSVIQPGATLRAYAGMDVRVGSHIPVRGGPEVRAKLDAILSCVNRKIDRPFETHVAYETLHPFMDGNGRSGRAIWLYQMGGRAPLGFLHKFYYQSLEANSRR